MPSNKLKSLLNRLMTEGFPAALAPDSPGSRNESGYADHGPSLPFHPSLLELITNEDNNLDQTPTDPSAFPTATAGRASVDVEPIPASHSNALSPFQQLGPEAVTESRASEELVEAARAAGGDETHGERDGKIDVDARSVPSRASFDNVETYFHQPGSLPLDSPVRMRSSTSSGWLAENPFANVTFRHQRAVTVPAHPFTPSTREEDRGRAYALRSPPPFYLWTPPSFAFSPTPLGLVVLTSVSSGSLGAGSMDGSYADADDGAAVGRMLTTFASVSSIVSNDWIAHRASALARDDITLPASTSMDRQRSITTYISPSFSAHEDVFGLPASASSPDWIGRPGWRRLEECLSHSPSTSPVANPESNVEPNQPPASSSFIALVARTALPGILTRLPPPPPTPTDVFGAVRLIPSTYQGNAHTRSHTVSFGASPVPEVADTCAPNQPTAMRVGPLERAVRASRIPRLRTSTLPCW